MLECLQQHEFDQAACAEQISKFNACMQSHQVSIFTVRNEVAKVLFLHLSVCPQGGVYLSACWDTTPPPEKEPPESRPPWSRHPPGRRHPRPWSRHPLPPWEPDPPGEGTPREQTPLEQTPPPREEAPSPLEQAPPAPLGTRSPRAGNPPPPPPRRRLLLRTGTHPTGMHSCLVL